MESGLEFVVADFPLANRFTLHILAAVAEYEVWLIAERTRVGSRRGEGARRKVGTAKAGGLAAVISNKATPQARRRV